MDGNKARDLKDPIINNSFLQQNWILFLPVMMMASSKIPEVLNFSKVDTMELEKKIRLLNRIKGYMKPEEQNILHRSEMILHIVVKVKSLMEISKMQNHETKYHSLSLDDRKRYMLMDIAEFVDDEKRDVIHKAIELNLKANMMGSKIKELQQLSSAEVSIETIEKYIEIFEPLVEGDIKSKTKELKILIGFLKLMKSISSKEKIDEMDIVNMVKPMVNDEQGESLMKMMQIFKALSTISNEASEKEAGKDLPQLQIGSNEEKKQTANDELSFEYEEKEAQENIDNPL
ncbi:hypothetical protein [Alkaliphilus peptidifermentans]|uniref:Uncharacterized protein n=1 Tax=Alkaliphilus peptidifermentans DSM 18978 TaxID=1120976 RepID=A0A1G5CR38_9FIRM|nr:hypothetical protein [Alkaliphilus peptidifermentans]SCY04923.1 hypothetical protein SAMN03080606_00742 [Alkaliphilus peptidifermentans DSM 18978]